MKSMNPQVSIITSAYNNSLYIKKAIKGVLDQTIKNWEYIIIDDASTDNTRDLISEYIKTDKRFKFSKNEKNLGITKNLNDGFKMAKGKYIAILDGDDEWVDKKKLEKQMNFLEKNSDHGIVGSFANAVDGDSKKLFEIKYPSSDSEIRKIMLKHSCFVHCSVLIRRSTLSLIGGYNIKYHFAEDYWLYLKLGVMSKFHNIPEFLVNYRINPLGVSRMRYFEQMDEMVEIIKEFKFNYPNYYAGVMWWKLRKIYPIWFRGALSRNVKKIFGLL